MTSADRESGRARAIEMSTYIEQEVMRALTPTGGFPVHLLVECVHRMRVRRGRRMSILLRASDAGRTRTRRWVGRVGDRKD